MWITNIVLKSLHSMCFSRSSLSICQYGRIVPLEHRYNTLLCCIFVDELLRAPLVIHIIEGETLPHAEMLVKIHIFLPLFFGDFSSQVLHNAAALVLRAYVHYRSELATLNPFSGKRGSDPDDHSEILTSRLVHAL